MICQDFTRRGVFPLVTALIISLLTAGADGQVSADTLSPAPYPVYPPVGFWVLDVDHILLRDSAQEPLGNSSLLVQSQAFLVTSPGRAGPAPSVRATYGPLGADTPIPPDLLLMGRRILPVLLARQVRSSAPVVRVLFHLPAGRGSDIGGGAAGADAARRKGPSSAKGAAHCVTAYAFWRTQEVRGACLLTPGEFCVAQLRPEPAWFSPAGRPAPGGGERGAGAEPQGNPAEVYFQSRRVRPGQCVPQDSLQRVGVGRGGPERSGTPLRKIGSVSLLKAPPGNPTFLRLRLGGSVVVQTSSKPLKTTDVATFYVFLSSVSTVENFTLRATVRKGLSFKEARPSDSALWDIAVETGRAGPLNTITVVCLRKVAITGKRGLLEILQLDFETKETADQSESQVVTWRLELPGNVKDVGIMRIYTTQGNYVGLAPIVMSSDLLNTAVLTGEVASVPVQTLAVGADGSVTDVTNLTSCTSTQEDTLKVSERCDYVYVNGKETRGRTRMLLNFTYGSLSAQLEMSVWTPRLPLLIDVGDPELSQIKGWRVPVAGGNRGPASDSEEDEEARKSRGCMLQYQHTLVRVLTPFTAEPAEGAGSLEPFLGPDWLVDVTRLVRPSLRVADPAVARLQGGATLQGRSAGTTTIQVLSPLSSSLLAERPIRVLEDRVSVTELGVQLVSGLSLTLQLSPGSNRAIVATATTQDIMTNPKQEAVVSCWVQFSDSSVTPLDLFDRASYSLAVTSEDETVATVHQTPQSTFVVAQGVGQGALVRAELRICEECQKTKRKSTLAVGVAVVKVDGETGEGGGAAGGGAKAESVPAATSPRALTDEGGDRRAFRTTVPDRGETPMTQTAVIVTATATKSVQQEPAGAATVNGVSSTTNIECPTVATTTPKTTTECPTVATTTTAKPGTATPPLTQRPPATGRPGADKSPGRGNGQRRDWANMADGPKPPPKERPRSKPPRGVAESDLVRAFRNMSDLQIGILALVGVSCLAFIAFALNCASYKLCFGGDKTPIQQGPPDPRGAPKDHKHDWVWLESAPGGPGGQGNPPQVSTLKREGHRAGEGPRGSVEGALSVVSGVPERTATLGRRSSSLSSAPLDPLANRSATLLAKPQRSEPLHSPTSKRNQVQFTTFTTLDIKHLAALKKNGVDFNWAGQGGAAPPPPPQMPLPDMPWPVVRPLGQPQ